MIGLVFGENLLAALEAVGKTQAQLADSLGVTDAAVCHWIKGRGMPATDRLLEIAEFCETSTDALLRREDAA